MTQNPTPHEFYEDSPSDIKLSTWEYHDFIDAFNDDRLSGRALMKFKELFRVNSAQILVVPVLSLPVAWFFNRWMSGTSTITKVSSTGAWLKVDSMCLA